MENDARTRVLAQQKKENSLNLQQIIRAAACAALVMVSVTGA
jgi:hypothetical protein